DLFFFSSRRRHTSFSRDWSSDVCSSDLDTKGEFWALEDVSFTVKPGEAIGVVGRNGQGKSTLLKLVAGVLLPDTGSVTVSGGVKSEERRVGKEHGEGCSRQVRDNEKQSM